MKRFVISGDYGQRSWPFVPCLANALAVFRVSVFGGAGKETPIVFVEKETQIPERKHLIDRASEVLFDVVEFSDCQSQVDDGRLL